MSNAANLPLQLLRGDYYQQTWSLSDASTGESLVELGDVLNLHFKANQGGAVLLTLNQTADAFGSAVSGINYATGAFQITIRAATLEALATSLAAVLGGDVAGDQLCGAYALQLVRGGQDPITYAYGPLMLEPAP